MHIVIPARIAEKLQISERQVKNTLQLLDDGATIPFISRYRKERTGGLDEIQIADISGEYKRLLDLQKRKETIVGSIEEQEKMTDELRRKIEETWSATELEDLYLPFKPKRRTRAQIARERGLEPLAKRMMSRRNDVETAAMRFVTDEVPTLDDALAGARDIIVEWINENPAARNAVRSVFAHSLDIQSDRKSTRLNSSHPVISYAVFCLKKK